MSFVTRTLLYSFFPVALLLMGTFFTVEKVVAVTVRHGLRSSLRGHQLSMAEIRRRNELQNSRTLRVLSENSVLKAGLQLVLLDTGNPDARQTLEDQLRELCETTGFDLLLASNSDRTPLAGVIRKETALAPIDSSQVNLPEHGFFLNNGETYQITSIPVNQGEDNLAVLSVGERFDISQFTTPVVLLHRGKVVKSSWAGAPAQELETALSACRHEAECDLRLAGRSYMSLAITGDELGDGYVVRSIQNVDAAVAPVQSVLRQVFVVAAIGALIAALMLTAASSRSIVKPIAHLVRHLREGQRTGTLPEFDVSIAHSLEIRELAQSFNHAAAAIREGRESLLRAYVECVGSLANALDARDPYTAGHSRRVSEFSCAVGEAINLNSKELEELRTGALLHDIGKIGIPDSVLQKPGRLTSEEFARIQEHPTIGRRILEGVNGLAPYLSTVELHHENWDGSGYPYGLRGEDTPLAARIVHVADAYDAMTSHRPYRKGMNSETALRILEENRGSQFDPAIVDVFITAAREGKIGPECESAEENSLMMLTVAVANSPVPTPQEAGVDRI